MKKFLTLLSLLYTTSLSSEVYLQPTPQFKPKVEVSAVYIEYNDLILLLHRQKHKAQGSKWGIPGGKVDKHESSLEAAIREVYEETGLIYLKEEVEHLQTVYIEYDEKVHFVYHMFRAKLNATPSSIKINFEEHTGYTWVKPEDGLQLNLIEDEDACFKLTYSLL